MNTRRDFLKTGSLLGLASLIAPSTVLGTTVGKTTVNEAKDSGETKADITVLFTSDIHGQLNVHDEFFWEKGKAVYRKRGGMAHLKSMIEHYRAQNPANTILIDGGDYFHGSAVASLTEGEALIPIFNELNYDLIVPGNWEVVYKKKKMLYDMGHSTAAKVCANMWHHTNDETNGQLIYPPYWVKYVGGIKIGFIGYTDHLIPKRQSPAYSAGISFTHATENIARYVRELREEEGCSLVFAITHMGLAQEVALSNHPALQGVDMILGADTHERVRKPIAGKYTSVIESGAFGSFLGKIDIHLNGDQPPTIAYELLDVDPTVFPAHLKTQALIDAAYAPFKKELDKVIGYAATPLVRYFVLETPMDNLITDAVHWKFKPDITVSNGFRFCQPLAVPDGGRAAITKDFLWNMLPVDSEVKRGWVTGKQIWSWLEAELENAFAKDVSRRFGGWFVRFSGMQVNFTISNEAGHRLNHVKIGDTPIDLQKGYSIIACEREGDPENELCRIKNVSRPERLGLSLHPIIEQYLATKPVHAPTLTQRATATDEPATLLTQVKGIDYEFC